MAASPEPLRGAEKIPVLICGTAILSPPLLACAAGGLEQPSSVDDVAAAASDESRNESNDDEAIVLVKVVQIFFFVFIFLGDRLISLVPKQRESTQKRPTKKIADPR